MKALSKPKNIFKYVLLLFLAWQTALALISWAAPQIIPLKSDYRYQEKPLVSPSFFWSRANFDGYHYLQISRIGYGKYQQAFFPFYPELIRLLRPLFIGKDLMAGLVISNFCLLGFLYFFYRLVLLDHSEEVAKNSLLFFLLFPTAFFLSTIYTESLFLFLVLLSFYAARKKKWFWAGILGALAAYTRLVGIFLFPALLFEWYQQNGFSFKKIKMTNLMSISLIPLGLLSYMKYLLQNYQDPLLFLHVQPFFGAERSGGKIILIHQVFWRYLKMILTTKLDPLYFTVWLELFTALVFLALLFFVFKKKIRLSYLFFSLPAFFLPSLSGTFSSLPRYVLVLFPCFMVLAIIKSVILKKIILFVFAVLFVIASILFFNGYWIS